MDRTSMHTAGQNHDQMGRVNMMYSSHYSGAERGGSSNNTDHDNGGMMDIRSRYLQLQKKLQVIGNNCSGIRVHAGDGVVGEYVYSFYVCACRIIHRILELYIVIFCSFFL